MGELIYTARYSILLLKISFFVVFLAFTSDFALPQFSLIFVYRKKLL